MELCVECNLRSREAVNVRKVAIRQVRFKSRCSCRHLVAAGDPQAIGEDGLGLLDPSIGELFDRPRHDELE